MTTEQYSIGYAAGYQDGFDAALAEPVKQEPVMIVQVDATGIPEITLDAFEDYDAGRYELYAAPVSVEVEWVDLTDDEIFSLGKEKKFPDTDPVYFARAVITAFKEKNK